MDTIELLKYPVGRFELKSGYSASERKVHIDTLRNLPHLLTEAVQNLTDQQLDTHYRDGGWTIRQVVHHLADSHINSYTRFKLAVTENNPMIRPYLEDRWALTPDGIHGPVNLSLELLRALHARLVWFLEKLPEEFWTRTFRHPESGITYTVESAVAMYAWHSKHHLAHITTLKTRMGW